MVTANGPASSGVRCLTLEKVWARKELKAAAPGIRRKRSMSLKQSLRKVITSRGPISIASYMQHSLVHPTEGYYVKRDPLGAKGDFITSPEISQMVGELIGVNIITQWIAHNRPDEIRIAELGPGRGTLMSDLMRAARVFKTFFNSIKHIDLVEASPALQKKQAEALSGYSGSQLTWRDAVKQLPHDGVPTFVIAHEFFDALPIHQFEKTQDGKHWAEKLVDYDPESDSFRFTLSRNPQNPLNKHLNAAIAAQSRFKNLPPLSSIEVCPDAWSAAEDLSKMLKANGGGALLIDYGPMVTIPVNTFRGFKAHHQIDPLSVDPGEADLTADVDFRALKDIFTKNRLTVSGPVSQADWLHRMGIGARAEVLTQNSSDEEGRKRITSAYKRLVDSGGMGKTYKVMGVTTAKQPMEGFQSENPQATQ